MLPQKSSRDFRDMKTHRVKKFKSSILKHDTKCHKCLTYGMKKYISKWLHFYCENTSLHGFRYISMAKSTIFEAMFWFVICVLSIVFCVILMLRLWNNYSNNPIATTIDTSNPITDVSFPGITICNNNKVYRPRADVIAKMLYNNGFTREESEKFFSSLPKLIRPDKIPIDNVTALQVLDNLGMSVETLMEQLMQPCSALLVRCAWIGQLYDCNKIFKTVKSKEGFCCAFNSHYNLNVGHNEHINDTRFDNNSIESNVTFSTDLPGVANILRSPGSGRDIGLSVALNVERIMYKAASRPHIGASVLIHDPIDFPDIGAHVVSALPGHVLSISVSCTSITSMDSLRSLPIKKRSCYFDEEVANDIRYSHQSCISSCMGKHIKRACGCLPFYYPEMEGVRTCYLPDIECLLNLRKVHTTSESNSRKGRRDRRFDPSTPEFVKRIAKCRNCLPQCTDLTYRCNVESNVIDDIGYDSDITRGLDIHNISFVNVFFGDVSYVDYRKESTISWDALLASFGGIFGLCLGGSVISVIEVIYLLLQKILKRSTRKRQEKFRKASVLPPASEIFLSIPMDKAQKPQSREEFNDKRVFVTWYQPTCHKEMSDYGYRQQHVKF